jgi:hypothetical protein
MALFAAAVASVILVHSVNNAINTPGTFEPLDESIRFENVHPDFIKKLNAISNELMIDPYHLLVVISFETGGTFRADIKNPNSSATGLIQFLESTARSLGTSTRELAKMDEVEQLDYVKKYLERHDIRSGDFGDLYMSVLYPNAVGKDMDYVLFKKGSRSYRVNKGLDLNKNGQITKEEACFIAYLIGFDRLSNQIN